jgi:Sortase domain
VLVVVAVLAQRSAPQPPRAAGAVDAPSPSGTPVPEPRASAPTTAAARVLGASPPRSISIPAVGVRSVVNPIGLNGDGTLAVPQPGPHLDQAAWFRNSPTPGQPGPSVIEGHVDSDQGPSVFFELGRVRPGNLVHVTRADGVRVTFTVDAVRDYKKSRFPTDVVYGAADLSRPELRLITCSQFDPSIRHHVGNEVVFAHLTSTKR